MQMFNGGDGVIQFAGLSYNGKVTEDGKSVEREMYIMAGLSGAPKASLLVLDGRACCSNSPRSRLPRKFTLKICNLKMTEGKFVSLIDKKIRMSISKASRKRRLRHAGNRSKRKAKPPKRTR